MAQFVGIQDNTFQYSFYNWINLIQDPNADTEWNDVLRAKGILPPKEKKELTEDDIVSMVENTIQQKSKGKGLLGKYEQRPEKTSL